MVNVYAVRISEFPEQHLNSVLLNLPEVRRRKLLQFRNLQDTLRGVVGDLLVRTVLSDLLRRPATELEFGVDFYGKPVLLGLGHSFRYGLQRRVTQGYRGRIIDPA